MPPQILPLDQIDSEDYLSPQELDDLAHQQQKGKKISPASIDYLAATMNHIAQIANGLKPTITVYRQNDRYRIFDKLEVVSAYAYQGIKKIPVEILPPDSLEIPAYLRRSH